MVVVWVPYWIIDPVPFSIPVEIGHNMPSAATNAPISLEVSGIELARAAVFSGRPGAFLQNPSSASNARFAQWRADSCLQILEPNGSALRRPSIFHSEIDSTEKGHLNFALGGALTMAYLANKLGIRWLAHYSLVTRSPNYNVLRTPSSRVEPDYIGMDPNLQFFIAEAKGRLTLDSGTRKKLDDKFQTGVVKSVNGQTRLRRFGIVAITGGTQIRLYATDPEEVALRLEPREWLQSYYQHVRDICGAEGEAAKTLPASPEMVPIQIDLPEIVSQWAEQGASVSEWEELEHRVRTQFGDQHIFPDLTVMTVGHE